MHRTHDQHRGHPTSHGGPDPGTHPQLLFAPANRPDPAAKFDRYDADCYVLDLEDGTPAAAREKARSDLPGLVQTLPRGRLSGSLFLRTNEYGSADLKADLRAARACGERLDGIVVPKLESAADLPAVAAMLEAGAKARPAPLAIIGGIESMAGVLDVRAIAASSPHLVALYFGAEDFASDLGGPRTGAEVLYARSPVVLAARAARLAAIDQTVVDIRDDALCAAEVVRARRLIATYQAAEAAGRGTIEFEGAMIDGPLLKRAQSLVDLSARIEQKRSRDAG